MIFLCLVSVDFAAGFSLFKILCPSPVQSIRNFFLKLGCIPYKAQQPLQGMELQEKEIQKDDLGTQKMFKMNLQLKDVCYF